MDDVVRLLDALNFPLLVLTVGFTGKIVANLISTLIDAFTRKKVLAVGKQYVPLRQSKDILSVKDAPSVFSSPGVDADIPARMADYLEGFQAGGERQK